MYISSISHKAPAVRGQSVSTYSAQKQRLERVNYHL